MKMRHAAIWGMLALSSCQPAVDLVLARDNGQWDATDADVRAWFRSLMQPDIAVSCCGEADAYYADSFKVRGDQYVAVVTDERTIAGRPPIPVGTEIVVPNRKLKYDAGNPTGHGVIFVNKRNDDDDPPDGWHVYCYIAPGGG